MKEKFTAIVERTKMGFDWCLSGNVKRLSNWQILIG